VEASTPTALDPARERATHDKVQELVAGWMALEGRLDDRRLDGAVRAALRAYYDRWRAWWKAWTLGEQSGLAGAVDDFNDASALGLAEEDRTRIANIHARLKLHNEAVEKAKDTIGEEPEFREYLARWSNFVQEMNRLGERAQAVFSWVDVDEIKRAEQSLNLLVNEWNELLPRRIELRRKRRLEELLEESLKRTKEKEAEGKAEGPKPGEKPTVIKLPETKPQMDRSTATTPPAGPGSAPEKKPDPNPSVGPGTLLAIGGAIATAGLVAARVLLRV
jgi:hypothetical protein